MSVIPTIEYEKNFDPGIKELLASKDTKYNEFFNTVENFRSFCSWDGDNNVDAIDLKANFGMLAVTTVDSGVSLFCNTVAKPLTD